LEAWKQKQAAEKERKQKELDAAGGTRGLLDEIDKKAQLPSAARSPAVASPAVASPAVASPGSPDTPQEDAAPVPYAGKFDPKAIAKKASSATTAASKLGTDVALPQNVKASATLTSNNAAVKANKPAALANGTNGKSSNSQFSIDLPADVFKSLATCRPTQGQGQRQWLWVI